MRVHDSAPSIFKWVIYVLNYSFKVVSVNYISMTLIVEQCKFLRYSEFALHVCARLFRYHAYLNFFETHLETNKYNLWFHVCYQHRKEKRISKWKDFEKFDRKSVCVHRQTHTRTPFNCCAPSLSFHMSCRMIYIINSNR